MTKRSRRLAGVAMALAVATASMANLGGVAPAEGAMAAGSPAAQLRAGGPIVLGYWARWSESPALTSDFNRHADELSIFAPLWHSLTSTGELRSRDWNRAALTSQAHRAGALVVPLVTNVGTNDAIVQNAAARQRGVENLVNLVRNAGYDGINVDFEGLAPESRAGMSAFVASLAARLHAMGKIVIVSVGAKSSFDESANSGAIAYDYAALGRSADYVQVMTYDQHGTWSSPGPVASLPWVERVVAVAKSRIPAHKILLGIAGYGYDWGGGTSRGVTARQALAKAYERGAPIIWDDGFQVPHYTYWTDRGARHVVWFENSYSVAFKTRLARQEGLAGVALWALGQEDERMWEVLNRYRNH